MANFNKVIMMGNLTRDPEYKQVGNGSLCRLSIASNRQYKNKNTGSMVQEVCFVDVDVWGNQADNCNQYLQKGRPVLVEGRLKLDTWEVDGQQRRKHSIVAEKVTFLGSQIASENSGNYNSQDSNFSQDNTQDKTQNTGEIDFKDEPPFEDELPF